MRPPVRVSGIGLVSAFGTSHDAFRDALLDGRTAIAPVTAFDTSNTRTTLTAALSGFDPSAWMPPMRLRRLDRTGVYAVAATRLALEDAGVRIADGGDDGIGVVLGSATAGGQSTQVFLEALFRGGPTQAPAMLFDSTVGNAAAGLTALEFKLRGPNVTVSHKEASGLAAIVGGVDLLREGRATSLFAGGVEAIYETLFKGHDRFRVMSPEPAFSRRVAPFDAQRSGFVMGEGGFGLWLEPGNGTAGRRGDILGVAASSAAVTLNAWPHDPAPLERTMSQALDECGLAPADVHVVYASANATGVLDATEARAIACVFGDAPIVTSIKGAIGEGGMSGVAACAAALLCGAAGEVPAIAGLVEPTPEAAVLRLARRRTRASGPVAIVNSFASGGALFSAVLRAVGRP